MSTTALTPGMQEDAAAGVRGHRVEVAGRELDVLALAGGRDVVDVVGFEAGLRQHAVVALLRQRASGRAGGCARSAWRATRLAAVRAEQRAS